TRQTREAWRSITICTVKIVCYVGSALFLFSLIMQLSFLYPSLWLFPPLWVDRIIIAMIGSYLLLKGWLSLQEFRLEREQSRAQSTSNLEPIALNKSYTLLYPWWIEHWLQPFTVIVHPPAQDPENQERTVMQRLASPIVSIRIRLFDTFCLILVGADSTQVDFTLRKRKPRYAA